MSITSTATTVAQTKPITVMQPKSKMDIDCDVPHESQNKMNPQKTKSIAVDKEQESNQSILETIRIDQADPSPNNEAMELDENQINTQSIMNLIRSYKSVIDLIDSEIQTQLEANDSNPSLSHCFQMLNMLRDAEYHDAVPITAKTELKINYWRNVAYFYLIRSTIKKCIDLHYEDIPDEIVNQLTHPSLAGVFSESVDKLTDVIQRYTASSHDDMKTHNELSDICMNVDIVDDVWHQNNVQNMSPGSEDQLRISQHAKGFIAITNRKSNIKFINPQNTKDHRLYFQTFYETTCAYIQLKSICGEPCGEQLKFAMQPVSDKQHTDLFYFDIKIDRKHTCNLYITFSYVIESKQHHSGTGLISLQRFFYQKNVSALVIHNMSTFTQEYQQRHTHMCIVIINHLLYHIVDYPSYVFAERILIGLRSDMRPSKNMLDNLWKQNVQQLNSESGSLIHLFRLQALDAINKRDLGIMDVFDIVHHALDKLQLITDVVLREKIGATIYYSFGKQVKNLFIKSVHVQPEYICALYSIFNYFRCFECVFRAKYSIWSPARVFVPQIKFCSVLNFIIPPVSNAQTVMDIILKIYATELMYRELGYKIFVYIETFIIKFCWKLKKKGKCEFAQQLFIKMMKQIIDWNCNQAESTWNYIWNTDADEIFDIISTDYHLWNELFISKTEPYIKGNETLINKINTLMKKSILRLNDKDAAQLKALLNVLSNAYIPRLNIPDLYLTLLENDNLWSSKTLIEQNLNTVFKSSLSNNIQNHNNIQNKWIEFILTLLKKQESIRNHILSIYRREMDRNEAQSIMSHIIQSAIYLFLEQLSCDSERCSLYLKCDEIYKLDIDEFVSRLITGTQVPSAWNKDDINRMQALYQKHCIDNNNVSALQIWNCIIDKLFGYFAQDTKEDLYTNLKHCLSTVDWLSFAYAHRDTLTAFRKWIDFVNKQLFALEMRMETKEIMMNMLHFVYKNQRNIEEFISVLSKMDVTHKLHSINSEIIEQYKKWHHCRNQIKINSQSDNVQSLFNDEFKNILSSWDTTPYNRVSSRPEWPFCYRIFQEIIHRKQIENECKKLKKEYTELLHRQQEYECKTVSPPREIGDGAKGLTNIGNTCFMNSIIQSLSHIPHLTNHFMNMQFNVSLCASFSSIISDIWLKRDEKQSLHRFKAEMAKISSKYGGYNMQDPTEFLDYLLNALHDELNTASACNYNEDANKIDMNGLPDNIASNISWKVFSDQNKSIIKDLFYGQTKSTTTCTKCGYIAVIFEPFRVLHVSTTFNKKRIKLYDCIDDFVSTKPIYGGWYCKQCREDTYATDQTIIYKYPSVLVIHLKKFEMQNIRKQPNINYPVQSPLELTKYCINKKQSLRYDLCAVSTLSGFHCTAYAKNEENQWFSFNDSRVTSIRSNRAKVQNAYLLFYQRRD